MKQPSHAEITARGKGIILRMAETRTENADLAPTVIEAMFAEIIGRVARLELQVEALLKTRVAEENDGR